MPSELKSCGTSKYLLELTKQFRKLHTITTQQESINMWDIESFDDEMIDPIDKWIADNNADVKKVKSVSYRKIKQELEKEFANEDFE